MNVSPCSHRSAVYISDYDPFGSAEIIQEIGINDWFRLFDVYLRVVLVEIWDLIEPVSEGFPTYSCISEPGRVAQSVGHLTRKSEVLGSIPGLATYFRFSFRFFKRGSCQLLAKVCARGTG